ncbi:MAG TPA: alginate export family protein, partial [Pirellulaceae bacterium]|nr:alginate export family protein [Pirellulaceae bacterium]
NIQDLNASLTVTPHEKLTALAWWHLFYLQDQNDVPYHVGGRPVVTTAGGNPYLGQELDLLLTYQITPRSDIVLGYSHFFTSDWYRTNPQARTGYTGDADFFYGQFTVRF